MSHNPNIVWLTEDEKPTEEECRQAVINLYRMDDKNKSMSDEDILIKFKKEHKLGSHDE